MQATPTIGPIAWANRNVPRLAMMLATTPAMPAKAAEPLNAQPAVTVTGSEGEILVTAQRRAENVQDDQLGMSAGRRTTKIKGRESFDARPLFRLVTVASSGNCDLAAACSKADHAEAGDHHRPGGHLGNGAGNRNRATIIDLAGKIDADGRATKDRRCVRLRK